MCKESGKCRWDVVPPEGWPKDVGYKDPNYIARVEIIKVIKSLEGYCCGSNYCY